jgi:Tfp pilus assembly protein PilV
MNQRGIALIEAVLALAVLAFGMLAVVGVQATLRGSGDLSRQRAEAVRIAQASIESGRSFTAIEDEPGVTSYQGLVSDGPTPVPGVNANYLRSRAVVSSAAARIKSLRVSVSWADRRGEDQTVELGTAIAGIAPDLAGTLALPGSGAPGRLPFGRHASIPLAAKDFGNGTSGFIPPQPGVAGVAWVFDNATGTVSVCETTASTTAGLGPGSVSGCRPSGAQLLSGYVRFAYRHVPTAAIAENPTDKALNLDVTIRLTSTGHPSPGSTCYDDAPGSSAAAASRSFVSYHCLVVPNASGRWSGLATVEPRAMDGAAPWRILDPDTGAGNFKVCRYTPASSDSVSIPNAQHPRIYTDVGSGEGLSHQNFLVIAAADSCPAQGPAGTGLPGGNTLQHQPPPR